MADDRQLSHCRNLFFMKLQREKCNRALVWYQQRKGAGKFKTRFHHFRYSSSERDEPPKRFHNIESQSFGPYGVVARARSGSRASTEPGGSGNGNKTPSYRSRSMSRSPQYAEAKRDLKASRELNKSTGDIMRSDLDNERAGRLRRAMSFK